MIAPCSRRAAAGWLSERESKAHFDRVCALLDTSGVQFTRDPKLVRGLDYYCHTAFEFITDALGGKGR